MGNQATETSLAAQADTIDILRKRAETAESTLSRLTEENARLNKIGNKLHISAEELSTTLGAHKIMLQEQVYRAEAAEQSLERLREENGALEEELELRRIAEKGMRESANNLAQSLERAREALGNLLAYVNRKPHSTSCFAHDCQWCEACVQLVKDEAETALSGVDSPKPPKAKEWATSQGVVDKESDCLDLSEVMRKFGGIWKFMDAFAGADSPKEVG